MVDKWEAVRALDPIAISQSLRAQAQKKPGEAQPLSGQEVSHTRSRYAFQLMRAQGREPACCGAEWSGRWVQAGREWQCECGRIKRAACGADRQVIGPLAGLPASRSGTRREVPPAVVNGKPLASATAGANGHVVSAVRQC